jgi:hypothetical protein
MNVPAKLQIFESPVTLTDKDAERLTPYLTGWPKLHSKLMAGVNEPDLQRLVILELLTKRRKAILDRLLMRLGRIHRHRTQEKINKVIAHA